MIYSMWNLFLFFGGGDDIVEKWYAHEQPWISISCGRPRRYTYKPNPKKHAAVSFFLFYFWMERGIIISFIRTPNHAIAPHLNSNRK